MNSPKSVVPEFMKNSCASLIRIKSFAATTGASCRMTKWLTGNKSYIECFETLFAERASIVSTEGILNHEFE